MDRVGQQPGLAIELAQRALCYRRVGLLQLRRYSDAAQRGLKIGAPPGVSAEGPGRGPSRVRRRDFGGARSFTSYRKLKRASLDRRLVPSVGSSFRVSLGLAAAGCVGPPRQTLAG